jgi:hypothetical protein
MNTAGEYLAPPLIAGGAGLPTDRVGIVGTSRQFSAAGVGGGDRPGRTERSRHGVMASPGLSAELFC